MIKVSRKKKTLKSKIPFIIIFLIGFVILIYPIVSRLYYRIESKNVITFFDTEKGKLSNEEIERRMELAKAYNQSLHNVIENDPYSKEKKEQGKAEYARMLEIKEYIGHIQIPMINIDIPMYAGTTEEVLQKGAGHLEGTSLPIGGVNTHTVITAHNGLPTAKLFTDLSKLEVGDKFYIHNFAETLAYQIDQIKIVEPSEFNELTVVDNMDYATLLTCTPYMINSHRLLVRGHRVEYVKETVDNEILLGKQNTLYTYLFYIILSIIVVLNILTFYYVLKKRKLKRRIKDTELPYEN